MELSIQRLSSQQAAPVSPFTPPSSSVTSPSIFKSILVTPQQPSVKHPPSHPSWDKPILATSTPTNSESSPTEVGVAVDPPPSSSDGEGKLIILCYLIICDCPWQTNHITHKIIFELRPPVPTMTFELLILQVSSPRMFGDMIQNLPGSPILQVYSKWNIATYVVRENPYTSHLRQVRGPTHKVIELAGCQNAWTRAAAGVSMEKD